MKKCWIALLLLFVGCGGEVSSGQGEVVANLTGTETASFGLSVLGWMMPPDSESEECLDNRETDWCGSTTSASYKEVRFRATRRNSFDSYYLYIRNNHSEASTVHLKVAVGEVVRINRDVTLNPGEKRMIGVFNNKGLIEWKNGF